MNGVPLRTARFFAILIISSAARLVRADAPLLASQLLAKAGISKGVACVPRCGDGALALAIAQAAPGMLVHATDADPANVATARTAAAAAGVLGRALYLEQGSLTNLVLVGNSVALLVIADAADSDVPALSGAEIARVLSPWRGSACIGRPAPVSGLTESVLSNWAAQLTIYNLQCTITNADGLWAIIRKPNLPGADDWSHRSHGADGTGVSRDSALKWPYVTQWLGKPYYDLRYHATHLIAGGRVFAIGCDAQGSLNTGFWARSAYNGQILWRRDLPTNIFTGVSPMIATPDAVYVMDGATVMVLDPETGVLTNRIVIPGLTGQA